MWYSVGTVYELKKDTDNAVLAYLKALKYEPRAYHAGDRIYRIYALENKWEDILEIFMPYQEKYPAVEFYTLTVADAFLHLDKFDQAKSALILVDGEEKEVPVLGKQFQEWFRGL